MGNESNNDHKEKIKEKLVELYADAEDLEAKLSNTSLAKMVVLNDKKRVPFLKRGMTKEANIVSKNEDLVEHDVPGKLVKDGSLSKLMTESDELKKVFGN